MVLVGILPYLVLRESTVPKKQMARAKKQKATTADNARQAALESMNMLPVLKKPVEAIGKEINVPGSHWGSNCPSQEKNKLFKCVVLDFTHMHRSSEDEPPHAAFQLNEMGVDGSGGNSEKFWMNMRILWTDQAAQRVHADSRVLRGVAPAL